MKKHILPLLLAMLPLIASTQKNYKTLCSQYMKGFHAAHDFSGAVLVAKKGKIVYQEAFGQANREWEISNTVDTRFAIASVTKQFTAVAILQLAEQGKLQLEDKLSRYYPDYPKGDSITLHMLLNHTSGISNLLNDPAFTEINVNTPIEALDDTVLINVFKNKPFDFSPGSFWRYSNSGYIPLGYIIEKVSGLSYRNYIHKNLLLKAWTHNSDLFRHDTILPKRASGYSRTARGWENSRLININISFAAGALFSTVDDLFKWNEALYAGKVISKESLAKMNQPNQPDRGAGYGVFIDQFYNRRAIFHSGALLGYSSFLIRYPDEEITIIILTNRETNTDFLPKALAAILFDQEVAVPYKRMPVTINTSLLAHYTGEFEGTNLPFPSSIVAKENKLYLRLGRDIELIPAAAHTFYIADPDVEIQLEYVLNSRKEINAVYFTESGVKTAVKRK